MTTTPKNKQQSSAAGFSLVELLVVVGIIGISAAVALPAVANFLRNYKINGAAQQVVGGVQQARLRAISKGVNVGVAFLPGYPAANQFQFILEDTVAVGAGAASNITTQVPAPPRAAPVNGSPHGFIGTLPFGATFVATAVAGAGRGIRFSRLGTACIVPIAGAGACPALAAPEPGGPLYVDPTTGDFVMTVSLNTLTRTIRVGPGGRGAVK